MSEFRNIPKTVHFAILTEVSVTIPGDERSRTHPGHGYPEETRNYTNYDVYTDREKWEKAVESLERRKEKYRALEVFPANVETTVSVKVGRS